MPRTGRNIAPYMPHHIVHRGHNRSQIFFDEADYLIYLESLSLHLHKSGASLLSWCLMNNHVHLLINPGEDSAALSNIMKAVAGRQTQAVNRRRNRTGSLWDGRYRVSLVETDTYFLAVCRYIELNPVKASMVEHPAQYRWSSYRENVGLATGGLVSRDDFRAFSDITFREYQLFVEAGEDPMENHVISTSVESNHITGRKRFVDQFKY